MIDTDRQGGSQYIGETTDKIAEQKVKKFWQQIIIHPNQSNWLHFWKFIIQAIYFYGYMSDPYIIAFYLTK